MKTVESFIWRYFDPYDSADPWVRRNRERIVEHLASQLVLTDRDSVLDLGCAKGRFLAHLLRRISPDAASVGIDLDLEALCAARERLGSKVGLICCDAGSLPFREASFRLVLLKDILHHAAYPKRVLEEALHVTAGGGGMVVIEANCRNPTMCMFTLYGQHKHFTFDDLETLLDSTCLPATISRVEAYPFYAYLRPGLNPLLWLWDGIWFLFHVMVKLAPSMVDHLVRLEAALERSSFFEPYRAFNVAIIVKENG